MKRSNALICYLIVACVVVVLDLWTKSTTFDYLGASLVLGEDGEPLFHEGQELMLVDGWFSLQAAHNRGAFNGWFGNSTDLLMVISLVAALATMLIIALPKHSAKLLTISLGLVAGGAIGNLYDRSLFHAVRDFIKVFYTHGDGQQSVWPNFNIADSAICCGVALLFLREFLLARAARKEGAQEKPGAEVAPPVE